jgi:hypothetical protein
MAGRTTVYLMREANIQEQSWEHSPMRNRLLSRELDEQKFRIQGTIHVCISTLEILSCSLFGTSLKNLMFDTVLSTMTF